MIAKTKTIKNINNNLANKLREAGYKGIGACIQCGTCTGSCPSGRRTALSTRTILRKVQLGIEDVLSDEDIWYCSTCYTCYERCPRNIPVTDMIIYLRNLAVKEGFLHKSHLELCNKLIETGHGVPIDDSKWGDLREYYGLKRIPPTIHSSKSALKEVQKLIKISKFDDLISVKPVEREMDEGILDVMYVVEDNKTKLVVNKDTLNTEKLETIC